MPSLRAALALVLLASSAFAQDTYKAEAFKAAPPDSVSAALKKELSEEGVRVTTSDGKPFAEIWLRKAIPASAKPSGPSAAVQFPVLAEGEWLGVVRFVAEGHDFRDQTIPAGVYTLRYGLQPVNGDHLGVSTYRDYGLLLPAAKDTNLAVLPRKKLETGSAETAGASHPAILMLVGVPSGTKPDPKILRDEAKNLSGAVLVLPLAVPNQKATEPLIVQLVIAGMAA